MADELLVNKWREAVPGPNSLEPESFQIRELPGTNCLIVCNPAFAHPFPGLENPAVFQSYDEDQGNLNLPDAPVVVCWADLLNEQVIDDPLELAEEFKEGCNEDLSEAPHPLVVPRSPLAQGHYLLPLFKDECLPQVISPELLTMALNVFRISDNPTFRLGYDSLGGGACYNHLHFHLLFLDQLPNISQFPIETMEKKLLLASTLQHKKQGEIDMFTQGIKLFEVKSRAVACLVVSPSAQTTTANVSEATESVGNVAGTIVNYLIEQNLPHNLLISEQGVTIYIFIRSPGPQVTFMELSGLIRTADPGELDRGEEDVRNLLMSVKPSEAEYSGVKTYILDHLKSLYKTG